MVGQDAAEACLMQTGDEFCGGLLGGEHVDVPSAHLAHDGIRIGAAMPAVHRHHAQGPDRRVPPVAIAQ